MIVIKLSMNLASSVKFFVKWPTLEYLWDCCSDIMTRKAESSNPIIIRVCEFAWEADFWMKKSISGTLHSKMKG